MCGLPKCASLAQAYSRESLIACFTELVVRVTDTPLMQRREVYFHFLGHIKATEGSAGAARASWWFWARRAPLCGSLCLREGRACFNLKFICLSEYLFSILCYREHKSSINQSVKALYIRITQKHKVAEVEMHRLEFSGQSSINNF